MPTSWKRADVNVLRANLQEALVERAASTDPNDWGYSDYDVEAIRAELDERQAAAEAAREALTSSDPPEAECQPCVESDASVDADLDRIRVLIARCFTPSRRSIPMPPRVDPRARSPGSRRQDDKASVHRLVRLQRLV